MGVPLDLLVGALKVEDVAHSLGVSPSTAKQHLFRARARLATLLAETAEVSSDVD